jgi:hypothetical protein
MVVQGIKAARNSRTGVPLFGAELSETQVLQVRVDG